MLNKSFPAKPAYSEAGGIFTRFTAARGTSHRRNGCQITEETEVRVTSSLHFSNAGLRRMLMRAYSRMLFQRLLDRLINTSRAFACVAWNNQGVECNISEECAVSEYMCVVNGFGKARERAAVSVLCLCVSVYVYMCVCV